MLVSKARLTPLVSKLRGKAPLCPWRSVFQTLDPRTFGIHPPPMKIEILERREGLIRIEFDGRECFWFPENMPLDQALWSEYLSCCWPSRINYHYYFSDSMMVSPGDTVVDCGACEGFFTQLALKSGAGKVICVEPSAMMISCLERTFESELEAGRVVIESAAIGSHEGRANFFSSDCNAFGGRMDASSNETVRLTTLASIAERHGKLDFLKMDLEGSEYEALLGGIEMLIRDHPKVSITTYHYPWDYPAIMAILRSAGYNQIASKGVTMRGCEVPRPALVQASFSANSR